MNDSGELVGFALLTMVLGGVGLVAYALSGRQRMRELMIRRGLRSSSEGSHRRRKSIPPDSSTW